MAKAPKKPGKAKPERKVTRYTHDRAKDFATPETGHTSLLGEERLVGLSMDNGWSKAIDVGKLEDDNIPIVVDMDPAVDPVLFWAGKRTRRDVPLLPLQRNEVVTESRIARIIERARERAGSPEKTGEQESLPFADLEKDLRESEKEKRIEFYTHEEGWKNKLICGDSLEVMESLIHHEGLRGKVHMIYVDPPYGIDYDSNFQQRVDAPKNAKGDRGDDVLTIRAFNDTWILGRHSYLSHLEERLYLCRELLSERGSLFLQINDENVHVLRQLVEEVFGAKNFVSLVAFAKTGVADSDSLPTTHDYLIWYAKEKSSMTYNKLWRERAERTEGGTFTWVELPDGSSRRMTARETRDEVPLPEGAIRFRAADVSSQGETEKGSEPVKFAGKEYRPSPGRHWKKETIERLIKRGRIVGQKNRLGYKRYETDFSMMPYTHIWDDTILGTFSEKHYVVYTNPKVVQRCIAMTTQPGDLIFDPTCGSGTSGFSAESLGRRWITCDTSRVAVNVARNRFMAAVFDHYRTRNGSPSSGFVYESIPRVTPKSVAYDLEPEQVELRNQPEIDPDAIRVSGPFEVMSLGRYSLEDWEGYLAGEKGKGELENYIKVIAQLYRKDAALDNSGGYIHAVVDAEKDALGLSIGPISGRVTARQLHDAATEAAKAGIKEVHVLGWAFEANVGEVKLKVETDTKTALQLVMIRPDSLAEGLKVAKPEALFSPLALPEIQVVSEDEELKVVLEGVSVFDRKNRVTEYKAADSGYVSAWYLDEDYDGDCFVDCQMFFDFKKKPSIEKTLGIQVDPDEWKLRLASDPFESGRYKRIAVKVVDVYGNESTIVRDVG